MQEILDAHAALGPLPIESLPPELARCIPLPDRAAIAVYGRNFLKKALAPLPLPIGNVMHTVLHGPGGPLLARIYTPKGEPPEGSWPTIVYFHGGGWVLGNLDTYDASCRALCEGAGAVVFAIHYRQAPENPWPAAAEDAYAAYTWVLAHGGDPARIVVAGESAGGNLAAVVCLMARDNGIQMPGHQLLVYPVTNLADGVHSASATEHAAAKPLNTPMLRWFYNHYAPTGTDRRDPYLSPLHAESHIGLPPATILLAEIDPLRSDGEAYAIKLREAGVSVNLRIYEGVTHEFFGMAGLVKEAGEAVAVASKDLREAFSREHIGAFA
jgi:acetyl esterase